MLIALGKLYFFFLLKLLHWTLLALCLHYLDKVINTMVTQPLDNHTYFVCSPVADPRI